MHAPTFDHWTGVIRFLRYLKDTIFFGLFFWPIPSIQLQAYIDANWVGGHDDYKPISGYCLYLGLNIISWSAKKKATVAPSNTESKYPGIVKVVAEILWEKYLLCELGIASSWPLKHWCNNIGAIYLKANPVFHARTKHAEINFHFV